MISDLARRAVRALAVTSDRLRPPPDGVVILLYHRVGAGTSSRVDLPASVFRDHMSELAESGRAVPLSEALDILAGRVASPHPRPVVVTFDDGTGDFVDHAVPILAEFGVPAILYAATAWIENATPFWGDNTATLSWPAIADVLNTGVVSIGSHTHDHVLLDRITAAETDEQTRRSRDLIGERLGVDATDFAYPKALAPTPANRAIIERHFRSATLAGTRPNRIGLSDPFALARSPVVVDDIGAAFTRKLDGGMGLEDQLRSKVDRLRYRGRTR